MISGSQIGNLFKLSVSYTEEVEIGKRREKGVENIREEPTVLGDLRTVSKHYRLTNRKRLTLGKCEFTMELESKRKFGKRKSPTLTVEKKKRNFLKVRLLSSLDLTPPTSLPHPPILNTSGV